MKFVITVSAEQMCNAGKVADDRITEASAAFSASTDERPRSHSWSRIPNADFMVYEAQYPDDFAPGYVLEHAIMAVAA